MPDPKPDSLKLGEGMVSRGLDAYMVGPILGPDRPLAQVPLTRKRMTNALTAALRLDDPEVVDRVAAALWHYRTPHEHPLNAYDDLDESVKESVRGHARCALAALLGDGGAE